MHIPWSKLLVLATVFGAESALAAPCRADGICSRDIETPKGVNSYAKVRREELLFQRDAKPIVFGSGSRTNSFASHEPPHALRSKSDGTQPRLNSEPEKPTIPSIEEAGLDIYLGPKPQPRDGG